MSSTSAVTPSANGSEPGRRHFGRWAALFLAAVYLIALGASYYQRWQFSQTPEPIAVGKRSMTVSAVRGDQIVPGTVTIAYRDVPAAESLPVSGTKPEPASPGDPLPIFLIHGSPGESDVFDLFMQRMNADPEADLHKPPSGPGERASNEPFRCIPGAHRLIAPDLPGFGDSSKDLPDYSVRAHARYVLQMMDKLGIARAHLLGFSLGGGVVLEMARLAPERVASLTMLSTIGVQEMEMLGDYHINHGIHGAQLAGLWLLKEGLPRFGSWNRSDMGYSYARNFYDTDQRPLRGILSSYTGPMLILHGQDDPLVPVEAAYEANRLVPQSELHVFPSNHFMVFMDPRPLVAQIQPFVAKVEAGTAITRATAAPGRIARAAEPMDVRHWPKPGPITTAVTLLMLALATFLSEDLACVTAGVLVAEGRLSLLLAIAACFVGIFVGDLLLYLVGRLFGQTALRLPPLKWILPEDRMKRAGEWLGRNGAAMVFIARFTPGARLPTYLAAGCLRTPIRYFLGYFLLAAAVWTPIVVSVAAGLGLPFLHSSFLARQSLSIKLLLGGTAILVIGHFLQKLLTFRGRRSLVGWWKRRSRWEFWSPYVFYPPVVLYVLYLGIRYRNLTLFTAADPAIPGGGFLGEQKHPILSALQGAEPFTLRFALIPAGTAAGRVAQAEQFLSDSGLQFPVVLKPDAGQRGAGVAVVRDREAMRNYLAHPDFPVILQEYAPGIEFGVFYYRYPDEPCGHIFSVTEKRMPVLTGDGKRTLERLILQDDRAVCMGDFYLRKNEARLQEVPAAGEPVQLVEIGTHCRGSIFLDGGDLATPALAAAIESIARHFDGFYFGRFDIRVPSREDLMQGRNFKIVELNGVTSEATHIYDPKITIWQAYRVLFEQWRIAFEIGNRNRARGVHPPSPLTLLRLIPEYRRLSRGYPE